MQRRHWLKLAGSAAAGGLPLLAPTTRLWAAPRDDGTRLLVVFLRGGYDAANLLVPQGSSFYYESRPNIAIARPGAGPKAALPVDGLWGLSPALADNIAPMFQRGQVAFVPFAGTDDLSRSHFETQDRIELGSTPGGVQDYRSGFMNRLAQVLGASGTASGDAPAGRALRVSADASDGVSRGLSNAVAGDAAAPASPAVRRRMTALAFTDQVPLAFRGPLPVANQSLRNVGKPAVDARQASLIQRMYAGTPMAGTVSSGFEVRDEVARQMAEPGDAASAEMKAANRNAINTKGFEQEARRIARLMRESVQIGFVDVGGWDTHVNEGGAEGALAQRLTELGGGLAGFADEMGPAAWQRTVVVVVSEFGRTFRENGNHGTDHGHGSVYWVLGGSVHGGKVLGEQQQVNASTLFQNRDYPVLNEYRALLGGLFQRMYGLNAAQIDRVFPGAKSKDAGLV